MRCKQSRVPMRVARTPSIANMTRATLECAALQKGLRCASSECMTGMPAKAKPRERLLHFCNGDERNTYMSTANNHVHGHCE